MNIKDVLKERKAKGMFVKIVDSMAMPILAQQAGMDFLFYDCEHGLIPYSRLHDLMLMGNAQGIPSIIRAAQLSRRDVSQALDAGAQGIMVPMIETPEQARQLVFWSKYPPMGGRSYSGGANTHYAPSGRHEQNMREMNERTLTIVQLETVKGIENAQAIAAVDGVDAIIVGPADLGISMGIPDNPADPRELAMIAKAAQAAKAHGKHFGIIGGNDLLSRFGNADLLISAIDTHLLSKAMKQAAKDYESWCMHE